MGTLNTQLFEIVRAPTFAGWMINSFWFKFFRRSIFFFFRLVIPIPLLKNLKLFIAAHLIIVKTYSY